MLAGTCLKKRRAALGRCVAEIDCRCPCMCVPGDSLQVGIIFDGFENLIYCVACRIERLFGGEVLESFGPAGRTFCIMDFFYKNCPFRVPIHLNRPVPVIVSSSQQYARAARHSNPTLVFSPLAP